jgi:hypothetical protein
MALAAARPGSMRSDLTRDPNDRRFAECGNGSPPCRYAPAPGGHVVNPLGLCDTHLREWRAHCKIPEPVECPACNPITVYDRGRHVVIPGAMCFACGTTNGGTVPSEQHRREAAAEMRARMLTLWRAGDRGPEWAALMARCPPQMRAAFEARLVKVTPAA